jgi:hypothetical protein
VNCNPGCKGDCPRPVAAGRVIYGAGMPMLVNPAYRRLWVARTVSQWGDIAQFTALALLVFHLTGSGLGVSGVVVVEIVPVVLLAPLAGPLVDRLPRVLMMVGADLARRRAKHEIRCHSCRGLPAMGVRRKCAAKLKGSLSSSPASALRRGASTTTGQKLANRICNLCLRAFDDCPLCLPNPLVPDPCQISDSRRGRTKASFRARAGSELPPWKTTR